MRKAFFYFIVSFLFAAEILNAQQNDDHSVPSRIVLNLTAAPSSSIAVTWRTKSENGNSSVQYAESAAWTEFESSLKTENAATEKLETENSVSFYHHSAVLKNLKPSVKYVYRVGNGKVWSEWNQFNTASDKSGEVEFVFFGDPQNDIKEHVSRNFRQAFKTAPDADFWLFGGDLCTEPVDSLWNELFYAAGFIPAVTPWILTPGNHDHPSVIVNGKKERLKTVTPQFSSSFTLPENGIPELRETNYFVDYRGVRIIILDTYDKIDEQIAWLDKILSENKNDWTVACFHYPIYSAGKDRDSKSTRNAFRPLFDKYGVDLVLTGHDHTYARSKKLFNDSVVNDNEKGTVYVVSVSGPKMYASGNAYENLMAKTGGNVQLFQVININGDRLEYKSFDVTGKLFDSFGLSKTK